jgi:hypothetical protein
VEPDQIKSSALFDMGFPEHYIPVALQLANNSMDQAAELILRMKGRASDLDAVNVNSGMAVAGANLRLASGGSSGGFGAPSLSYAATGSDTAHLHSHGHSVNNSAVGGVLLPRSNSDPSITPRDEITVTASASSIRTASSTVEFLSDDLTSEGNDTNSNSCTDKDIDSALCPMCSSDDILKRDQLIPCNGCERNFHASCLGFRRIPFSLKTPKERMNREKYILKHYGLWMCQDCVVELENRVSSPSRQAADDSHVLNASSPHSAGLGLVSAGGGKFQFADSSSGANRPSPGGHSSPAVGVSSSPIGGFSSGSASSMLGSLRVPPMPSQAQTRHDQVPTMYILCFTNCKGGV